MLPLYLLPVLASLFIAFGESTTDSAKTDHKVSDQIPNLPSEFDPAAAPADPKHNLANPNVIPSPEQPQQGGQYNHGTDHQSNDHIIYQPNPEYSNPDIPATIHNETPSGPPPAELKEAQREFDELGEKFHKWAKVRKVGNTIGSALRWMRGFMKKTINLIANGIGWSWMRGYMRGNVEKLGRCFGYHTLEDIPTVGVVFDKCKIIRPAFSIVRERLRGRKIKADPIKYKILPCYKLFFTQKWLGSYEKKLKGMQKDDPELYKELMAGDITLATEEFHQTIGPPKKKEPGVKQKGPHFWQRIDFRKAFRKVAFQKRQKRLDVTLGTIFGLTLAAGCALMLLIFSTMIMYETANHWLDGFKCIEM